MSGPLGRLQLAFGANQGAPEAAFARARAEDKPILLDIGAVWCMPCQYEAKVILPKAKEPLPALDPAKFAAGVDVVRGRNWAIDLEVRAGFGFYGDDDNDGNADIVARNLGFGAAITWF